MLHCTSALDATMEVDSDSEAAGADSGEESNVEEIPAAAAAAASGNKRKRLTLRQKGEVLDLLDKKTHHAAIANKFECNVKTVQRINRDRESIKKQLVECGGGGKLAEKKSNRKPKYPDIDRLTLESFDRARQLRLPMTRDTLRTFGLKAQAELLKSCSEEEKLRLESFTASEHWVKRFVTRNQLASVRLHGEAGSVDPGAIASQLATLATICADYEQDNIYNVDETGLYYKLLPRRSYISTKESKKTVRGTKGMTAKDRLSFYICTNATGTRKVSTLKLGELWCTWTNNDC
jgi:hypothetical protein